MLNLKNAMQSLPVFLAAFLLVSLSSCEKEMNPITNPTTQQAVENNEASKVQCSDLSVTHQYASDPTQDGQVAVKILADFTGDDVSIGAICSAMGICHGSNKEQMRDGFNGVTTSGYTAFSFSGLTLSDLKTLICNGTPVLVLVKEAMDNTQPPVTMVISGFDDGHMKCLNPRDPNGHVFAYSNASFLTVWNSLGAAGVQIK